MSKSKRPRGKYKTTNWADYNKALKARGSLTKGMQWYATATGKRGRHPVLLEHQVLVRSGSASKPWIGRKPVASGRPGLEGARLEHRADAKSP